MPNSTGALSKVHKFCVTDTPVAREIPLWLAGSVGRFLDHASNDPDDAFGLNGCRGDVLSWMARGPHERDGALKRFASKYLPDLPVPARARKIEMFARGLAGCDWRCDESNEHVPEVYEGTCRERLWIAFPASATLPHPERHIRNVLKDGANEGLGQPDRKPEKLENIANLSKRGKSK